MNITELFIYSDSPHERIILSRYPLITCPIIYYCIFQGNNIYTTHRILTSIIDSKNFQNRAQIKKQPSGTDINT